MISFRLSDSRYLEIPYLSLLKYVKTSNCSLSFWASIPDKTEIPSGLVDVNLFGALTSKFDEVMKVAQEYAEEDYSKITPVPPNATRVNVREYIGVNLEVPFNLSANNTYIWSVGDDIYMMPMFGGVDDFRTRPHVYKPVVIRKQSIVALTQEGDVYYTTEVHGGGGGGSSIKGAVIGGVLAGEAGAIIGSRKATDPIKSTTQRIDERATHMKVLDANNQFFEIVFNYNDYYAIQSIIK